MIFSLAVMTVFGCGGGGGAAGPTTVSGVASAGPIINGHVEIFAIDTATGHRGAQLTTVTTDANGAYNAPLGTFTGPIEVEVTQGTYKDEATGATVPLTTPLRATISNAAGNTSVMVTPLTELAVRELPLDVHSAPNIDKANADISAVFKVNIITTKPADATIAASAAAPAAEKEHGLVLAAISQLMKNSGKSLDQTLVDMSTAITGATMPVNTTAGYKAAMFNFISDTNLNKTGVTPDAATAINPTTVKVAVLKIRRAGGGTIGGMDFTMTLPGDATMAADATTKQTADGAVAISGVAATGANILSTATFDATSKKLRVLLANPNGFAAGQMVTVACSVPATPTVTPAQLQAAVAAATGTVTDLAGVQSAAPALSAAAPVFF
jgi:hypothetical protein